MTAANLVATVLRFVLLRVWVFRSEATHVTPGPADERVGVADPVSDLATRVAAVAGDDDVTVVGR